jgi:hypothetical protein
MINELKLPFTISIGRPMILVLSLYILTGLVSWSWAAFNLGCLSGLEVLGELLVGLLNYYWTGEDARGLYLYCTNLLFELAIILFNITILVKIIFTYLFYNLYIFYLF